jgi:MFS family permease
LSGSPAHNLKMSKATEVLKNKNFLFLWFGQIISQLGDRLGQMALIGLVYLRAPGSSVEIAKILSFTILPVFLVGPIAGAYVDRWDRRRTMYICDFLRTLLVLIIPLFLFSAKSSLLIYLLVFLIFCIGRFFIPAKLAIVPDLVDTKDLLMANSLTNITGMIAAVIGFGIAGVLVEWLGAKGGFYLDALSFFISALFIFLITKKTASSVRIKEVATQISGIVKDIRKSLIQEIKDGIIYFIRQKEIRFTASVMFLLWSALGSVYVVLIVFVQKTLHSVTKDLGLLIMFLGVGLLLGSLIYGKFGQRLSHYKAIFSSLILSGIMLAVFSLSLNRYPNFFMAAILTFIFGLLISPIMIASTTLIHKTSDNHMMGKTFSSLEIIMHLAFLLFMFISSILAERVAEINILLIVSIVFIILGIINLIYHRKLPWLD